MVTPIVGTTTFILFVFKRLAAKLKTLDSCNKGSVTNTKNQAIEATPATSIKELNKNKTIKKGILLLLSSINKACLDNLRNSMKKH